MKKRTSQRTNRSQKTDVLRLRLDYQFQWAVLLLAAVLILTGATMTFLGLQGTFNWVVEAPHTVAARMTNASPGIVFATMGMVLAVVVTLGRKHSR